MKRRRHTPEQIVRKLAEGEKLLGEGKSIDEVARHLEITESTWHRWRNQYGGMKADDAKRLKELERENHPPQEDRGRSGARYRHAEGAEPGKLLTPDSRRRAVVALRQQFGVTERRVCRVVGQSRSTQRLAAPVPSDDELALRAWLRDFSGAVPAGAGGGRRSRPRRPVGRPTTSASTASGSPKACGCPIASARSRCGASGSPSGPCAPSGPTPSGPWTSSSTRPLTERCSRS